MKSKRDDTIDIIRGLAIFTMIGANMAPALLNDTPSIYFRLYGSFAAPIFIFLSGMMVSFTVMKGNHSGAYYLKRTIFLLVTGALIDIFITGVYPFMTFDVLYLIGVSTILTYLFKKLKISFQYMLAIFIFAVTPIFQNVFGYRPDPAEIPLSTAGIEISCPLGTILKQWFIDGWFPMFPWLGFAFLGSVMADIRFKRRSFSNSKFLFWAFTVLVFGEIIWSRFPGEALARNGYCELFYPPTIGFILASIGIILILFYIVDLKNNLNIYKPFSILGRWSLQIYVIHLIMISLLGKIIRPQSFSIFLFIYFGIALLLLSVFSFIERHFR